MISDAPNVFAIAVVIRTRTENGSLLRQEPLAGMFDMFISGP